MEIVLNNRSDVRKKWVQDKKKIGDEEKRKEEEELRRAVLVDQKPRYTGIKIECREEGGKTLVNSPWTGNVIFQYYQDKKEKIWKIETKNGLYYANWQDKPMKLQQLINETWTNIPLTPWATPAGRDKEIFYQFFMKR